MRRSSRYYPRYRRPLRRYGVRYSHDGAMALAVIGGALGDDWGHKKLLWGHIRVYDGETSGSRGRPGGVWRDICSRIVCMPGFQEGSITDQTNLTPTYLPWRQHHLHLAVCAPQTWVIVGSA